MKDSLQEGIFVTTIPSKELTDDQQQTWRTQLEIGLERQEQLAQCLATIPDITQGIYPFTGMKLTRADVEWLLAAHVKERRSSGYSDEQQYRKGLDVRGADLQYTDLHALPLTRMCGSLTRKEWDEATTEQRAAAVALLTGADLSEAHLEEAELIGVHLEKVALHEAHLEKADLSEANLVGIPTLTAIDPEFNTPANGVGFAIPSNRVQFIVSRIIQRG